MGDKLTVAKCISELHGCRVEESQGTTNLTFYALLRARDA